MNNFFRASALIAVVIMTSSILVPAVAAEDAIGSSAKATPNKHRQVARRGHPRSALMGLQTNLGCRGEWCGRQFVLMIGIGF